MLVAPCDEVLSETVTVQPDVIYLSDAHRVTAPDIQGPPTRVRERELYARFGVPEHWVVSPDADRVEALRLAGAAHAKPLVVERGEHVATDLAPGLTIDVAELLAP